MEAADKARLQNATTEMGKRLGVTSVFVDLPKVQELVKVVSDAIRFEGLKCDGKAELRAYCNGIQKQVDALRGIAESE